MAAQGERQDQDVEQEKLLLSQPPPSPKRSTAYLDGLRGFAALMVFNGHMIGGGWQERGWGMKDDEGDGRNYMLISFPIIRLFYIGAPAAVSVFFVLSGFVITQSLVKLIRADKQQEFVTSLKSTMLRRPIRLFLPCVFVSLIIGMALHLPYNIYPSLPWLHPTDSLLEEPIRVLRTCWNFFWPFQTHGSGEAFFIYDMVVWTIPIEFKGSFMCYGLVALYALAVRSFGLSSPVHIWSIGGLAVLAAGFLEIGAYWQACFVFGFLLTIVDIFKLDEPLYGRSYDLVIGNQLRTLHASTIAQYAVLLGSLLLMSVIQSAGNPEWETKIPGYAWLYAFRPKAYDGSEYYRFWTSLGAMGFVYSVLRVEWLQRFFHTRPLMYLGKVSFMLYLCHLPFAYTFSDRFIRVFGHVGLGSEPRWWDGILWLPEWGVKGLNVRWVVAWCVILAVNLALAHFFTKHIDEPVVRMAKNLSGALGLNPPPKTAPAERLDIGDSVTESHHMLPR